MMAKYVAYYRVSTKRQGESGLGLEAQRSTVTEFCSPIESFTEVESGKRSDRPQLQLAIAACRRRKATLVIAKLDRLARNVAFVSALMDSGCEFLACDNPHASRLTIHILAAVAEDEARRISQRTKDALAAAKRRGVRLGGPKPISRSAARKGTAANVAAAASHNSTPKAIAFTLRKNGQTLAAIADALTQRGILTRWGNAFTPRTVLRLLG